MPQREKYESTMDYVAEGAITAHRCVVEGTADGQVKPPGAANAVGFVGVSIAGAADKARVPLAEAGDFARVLCNGNVARGDWLRIHSSAGDVAAVADAAASGVNHIVGRAKSDGTTGQMIWMQIWPVRDHVSA